MSWSKALRIPSFTAHTLFLTIALSSGSGCISHRAQLHPPDHGDQPRRVVAMAVDGRIHGSADPIVESAIHKEGPLPLEIQATLWQRDQQGNLWRGDAQVQSPRPWWQRFPFDVVSDLAPITFSASAASTITVQRVPSITISELNAAAARFGFAGHDSSISE